MTDEQNREESDEERPYKDMMTKQSIKLSDKYRERLVKEVMENIILILASILMQVPVIYVIVEWLK